MLSTDSAALEYAFSRYRTDVYAFVLSRTRNRHDAEELTQQTFVDAAAALSRGFAPRAMRSWLFAVAARRVTDERRRRSKSLPTPDGLSFGDDATSDTSLATALRRLSPTERGLLFLRVVEERTHVEIGAIVGCTESASRMRISRTLARLRRELGADV